jgi:NTP pyrophosphatase (non-canonical NTP hydrolase)
MSTIKQDIDLVENLSTIILGKLRANRFKEHWRTLSTEDILRRIDEEVVELKEAVQKGKISNICLEASDVAVFCAMLIDNISSPETD